MIEEYVDMALAGAKYEFIKDKQPYYGEISICRGVWATGKSLEECRENLKEVLEGWILVRLKKGLSRHWTRFIASSPQTSWNRPKRLAW